MIVVIGIPIVAPGRHIQKLAEQIAPLVVYLFNFLRWRPTSLFFNRLDIASASNCSPCQSIILRRRFIERLDFEALLKTNMNTRGDCLSKRADITYASIFIGAGKQQYPTAAIFKKPRNNSCNGALNATISRWHSYQLNRNSNCVAFNICLHLERS